MEFTELALAVFEHQFECNPIYRSFSISRGAKPGQLSGWPEIPAVPTDAFKAAPLLCGSPTEAEAVFRTSGTTRGAQRRGSHYLLDTSLYRSALLQGFAASLLSDRTTIPILSLVPPWDEVPDSSLSFMISCVIESFGEMGSEFFAGKDELRTEAFIAAAHRQAERGEPILIAGTSLALVEVLAAIGKARAAVRLPPGSRVMDTGGSKGAERDLTRAELYERTEKLLGIPPSHVINEYGMTEMSSQFYDGVAGAGTKEEKRSYTGAGWVRSIAVSPEDLTPLPAGEIGVLRHLDLANLDSVMAIQTADLGSASGRDVRLRGRATGAEARGCSLATAEMLAAMGHDRG